MLYCMCQPGKFISTLSIDIDCQPAYIRVHPVDVAVDKVAVQRALTTGELKLTLPVAAHVLQERREKRQRRLMLSASTDGID